MFGVILSLPHSHRYSDLCRADSSNDFRPYVSITGFAFYIVVRCDFTTVRYTLISNKSSKCIYS